MAVAPLTSVTLTPATPGTIETVVLYDAVAARDEHSAGSELDGSIFAGTSDKNGDNTATWTPGTGSIPQKVDIIDVGGHLRQHIVSDLIGNVITDELIAVAFATTRNVNGDAHIDFEIFREDLEHQGGSFINGGPDAGHTATRFNSLAGEDPLTYEPVLNTAGDILVSIDYGNGGTVACGSVWIWVDPNNIDGAGTTLAQFNTFLERPYDFIIGDFFSGTAASPYGYARVMPRNYVPGVSPEFLHASINETNPVLGPTWGSLNAQNAAYDEFIQPLQLAEISLNFTRLGLINSDLITSDSCSNILGTLLVKTRSSNSVTSEMKDFAGPYLFGVKREANANAGADQTLACQTTQVTLTGSTTTGPNPGKRWYEVGDPSTTLSNTDELVVTEEGCYVFEVTSPFISTCIARDTACVTGTPDTIPPVISCPQGLTVSCINQIPAAATTLAEFIAQGGTITGLIPGEGTISHSDSPAPPYNPCGGTFTRTYTIADSCGNTADCTQQISIDDNIDPVITGPGNLTITQCNPIIPPGDPNEATATDNCGTVTVSLLPDVITGTCLKTLTRTWRATDACGNTADHVQVITYKTDSQAPVITVSNCGTPTLPCNPTLAQINGSLGTASVTDNCDNGLTATPTTTYDTSGCSGRAIRTWNVSDVCGNPATAVRCTVLYKVDNTAPVITVSNCGTPTLPCNPTLAQINGSLGTASVTDNCDNGLTATSTTTYDTSGCSGRAIRTWNVSDICGNQATAVRCTVLYKVDNTAPVITITNCGSPTLPCNPTLAQINGSLGTASVTDNCDNGLIATPTTTYDTSGCSGRAIRTWNVSDVCGNPATAVRCTVLYKVDNTAPVITVSNCGTPTLPCNPTLAQINGSLGTASVTDNCDNGLTATATTTYDTTLCNGRAIRTWNVTDLCGNQATAVRCTVNYTVDVTPPVVSCNVPGGIITVCEGSPINYPTPSATDNCTPGNLVVTCTPPNAVPSPGSSITVTCSATDACGNTGTCSYSIRVVRNPSCTINLPDPKPLANSCNNQVGASVNGLDGNTTYTWTINGGPGWTIQSTNGPTVTYCAGSGSAIFCLEVKNTVNGVECISTCCDTVECQPTVFCSYTQGYYGNAGGNNCTGGNTTDLLEIILTSGPLVLGDPTSAELRSLTLSLADLDLVNPQNSCIYRILPGGGPGAIIPASTDGSSPTCSSISPIPTKSNGTIRNVFLAQTITLGLNLRIPGNGLGGLEITNPYMVTYESTVTSCPSSTPALPTGTPIVRMIPISVVNYLNSSSSTGNTVQDLFNLANRVLSTSPTDPSLPSLTSVSAAVAAFNEGFDECRVLDGFYPTNPLDTVSNTTTSRNLDAASPVGIHVYPNPAHTISNIEFILNGSDSEVTLEVYNINGVRVDVLFNANAEADVLYRTQLDAGQLPAGIYTYRLTTKSGVYTDRITIVK
jgi:hypothetical protein